MKFREQRKARTAPRQFFGLAGTSFELNGTHPSKVTHNKRVYRYVSGQFFSFIDGKQMIDHETKSNLTIGSGDEWLVGIQLGLS